MRAREHILRARGRSCWHLNRSAMMKPRAFKDGSGSSGNIGTSIARGRETLGDVDRCAALACDGPRAAVAGVSLAFQLPDTR